jgi:hypothetical protein
MGAPVRRGVTVTVAGDETPFSPLTPIKTTFHYGLSPRKRRTAASFPSFATRECIKLTVAKANSQQKTPCRDFSDGCTKGAADTEEDLILNSYAANMHRMSRQRQWNFPSLYVCLNKGEVPTL